MRLLPPSLTGLITVLVPAVLAAPAPAYLYDLRYDESEYGSYPRQKFMSVELDAPQLNLVQSSDQCEKDLYTLLSPRGEAVPQAQATILDHAGELIWTTGWEGQQIYNLMVQEYHGEQYLTFWAGNDAVGGHGAGFYYLLDRNYNLFKKIEGAHGLDADLHEFRLTSQGTALSTLYEVVEVDLSSAGKPFRGAVWDCILQEIDLETGEALFEWRALEHYNLSDSFRSIGKEGQEGQAAYDYFHINSIDKDSRGNYLISSRYLHCLTYIDGATGDIIWTLGGKRNMFRDLSGGRATNIAFQHDARWSDNETTITIFDNAVDDVHPELAPSRGLRLTLDQEAMTAEVVTEYFNLDEIRGTSQGSCQTLPSGNVVVGYGNSAAFTEFSHDGEVLCDTHFGPQRHFGSQQVQSYRVYKFEWHGWPQTDPDANMTYDAYTGLSRFYVSWNGATEVKKWRLQGALTGLNGTMSDWMDLAIVPKRGFETMFEMDFWHPQLLRAVALDADGNELGVTAQIDATSFADAVSKSDKILPAVEEDWVVRFMYAFLIVLCLGMLFGIGQSTWSWKEKAQTATYQLLRTNPHKLQ